MKIHYMKIQKFMIWVNPGSVSENSNYKDYPFWICWRIKPNQSKIFYSFHSVLPLYYNLTASGCSRNWNPLKYEIWVRRESFHLNDIWNTLLRGICGSERDSSFTNVMHQGHCTKSALEIRSSGSFTLNSGPIQEYIFPHLLFYIYFHVSLSLFSRFFQKLGKLLIFLEFSRKPQIHLNTSTFHAHILWPMQALFI